MSQNNWYVITGGPCTGKTTLLAELATLGHATVPEAARLIIDEGFAQGKTLKEIRADEQKFQHVVLERKKMIEANTMRETVTLFDRGMHDTIAYLKQYGWEITKAVEEIIKNATYRKVFLLEPLPHHENDYARTEDKTFTVKLNKLLRRTYQDAGLPVISVPPLPLAERVDFVLKHIQNKTEKGEQTA